MKNADEKSLMDWLSFGKSRGYVAAFFSFSFFLGFGRDLKKTWRE